MKKSRKKGIIIQIEYYDKVRKTMYKVLKRCGMAKRAEFHTPHGVIQTPVFMNVGTAGAIKGAVSTEDLEQL